MLPRAVGFRSEDAINPALIPWLAGGCLAVFGAAFALASLGQWRAIVVELGPVSLILLTVSLLSPEIILVTNNVWHFQPLTQITFQSVFSVLKVLGVEAIADPTRYLLSSNSFSIRIEPACSGVEGFALTTLFFVSYFYAFKEYLRFPNVWVLLPIALLVSGH